MARGLIFFNAQSRTTSTLLSTCIATLSLSPTKCQQMHIPLMSPLYRPSTRFFCKCSHTHSVEHPIDMTTYKEAFSRRMAMAGLKPHHRIALGVSGGPDSMALCVLTADWKTGDQNAAGDGDEFIDGLLAIIVDHGLREESREEAKMVSSRVSDMGIRCEIDRCSWLDGRPKKGHLQEAARDMRYQIFQNVCMQHHIGALLVAHHADDQAELFIIRFSRNSGVLGLAGMAFTSQIFSTHTHSYNKVSKNHSILLVRPLLEFSKEDMYKICQGGNQDWVEDPTNRSPLFARNRIRMSLGNLSSCIFKSELQAIISTCRKTRSYVDHICSDLINRTVTIVNDGYAVIDLEILNPSKVEDICLTKFLALVLQFISQRQRPIRGSASKLLLDYIRTFPCKTSLTAAGCFLCPAPRSRGAKALVCCSVDCPLPSKMELIQTYSNGEQTHFVSNIEQIIADAKSYTDQLVPDASKVHFLDVTSDSVLTEAKRFNIVSESTYRNILLLQREEIEHFKTGCILPSCQRDQVWRMFNRKGSLPVLVNNHGQLLSIPHYYFISINFSHCPCLIASAVFDPKEAHISFQVCIKPSCKFCRVGSESVQWLCRALVLYMQNISEICNLNNWPYATLQNQGWYEISLQTFLHLNSILASSESHVNIKLSSSHDASQLVPGVTAVIKNSVLFPGHSGSYSLTTKQL
ncbi:hypothetical protein EZV62_012756 [Acer yangbiense]|uniref:tRNA(Ile)-lysidine synthetase n=1 Tax=Acer yangbiense TaxID=1000413 RepID=A0A5C7HW85_9ROSI|nr:hypothetical protein EZV62_012756 [Acer yangbiense]